MLINSCTDIGMFDISIAWEIDMWLMESSGISVIFLADWLYATIIIANVRDFAAPNVLWRSIWLI